MMADKNLSAAAKIYLLSGKISHLTEGFCFTKSPTGEMVNTQRLAEAMILVTLLELVQEKKLEMKDESKKVLFMVSPIITLKRLGSGGVALAKAILDRLEKDKSLTEVVTEIVGGVWLVPQYSILGLVEKEFVGLFKEVEVKKMFGVTGKEKVWEEKKIAELVKNYEQEAQKAFQATIDMPLRMMSLSSLHIAWGQTTKKKKEDRDD
jgi:hypothetical protein